MNIERLWIEHYKNLDDFEFTTAAQELTTVLIGPNGTGKSNLIEAIVWIFRNLDLGLDPQFTYRLTYTCRGQRIVIDANRKGKNEHRDNGRSVEVRVDGTPLTGAEFRRRKDALLPTNIFCYYSGASTRLESLFNKHFQDYYDATLKEKQMPLRRLFYCHLEHGDFSLLGFFAGNKKTDKEDLVYLSEQLEIAGIESVLFVLRQPWWFKGKPTAIMSKEGDKRFWYARGLVRNFVSALWNFTLPPIRDESEETLDFRGKKERKEWLYLYLPDETALRALAAKYQTPKDFFKGLEATWINDLIAEPRILVRRVDSKNHVPFKDLSDGERQYLMVLGLLKFTREDESLFLLDEPDTHLNPRWKFEYLNTIERFVGKNGKSQMLIATHDPLVVLSLTKNQVRLFKRDIKSKKIKVEEPYQNPSDLSISTLLTSELYGLRATVAPEKLQLLDKKRILASKEDLSEQEKEELRRLSEEVGGLDASVTLRDPLYKRFVEAMTVLGYRRGLLSPTPTAQQRNDEREMAKEVLTDMVKEEHASR